MSQPKSHKKLRIAKHKKQNDGDNIMRMIFAGCILVGAAYGISYGIFLIFK